MKFIIIFKFFLSIQSIHVSKSDFIFVITSLVGLRTRNQQKILEIIYKCFKGKVDQRTLLFLAASLHNTSNFTVFSNGEIDEYRCRGLLKIGSEENYKKLTILSGKRNYLKIPNQLCSISKKTIKDCIKFF
ncbi:spore wall protein 2 [Vairimorpha necatrix]|uniref:Spore wall protein 2 n=1 Tax=Vairimorpha necatrix TaxID=6039 RepID=A0AAX4JGQ7_9MICR